jgi:hypothetical protein
MKYYFFLLLILFANCADEPKRMPNTASLENTGDKMNGVSLEMPFSPIGKEKMAELKQTNADWVAMIPYGYTEKNGARVFFNYSSDSWWGESLNGTKECIKMAQKAGLKVMLKPHVWVVGQGWPGDFDLKTEEEWLIWEKSYRDYILACAHIADSTAVDLFCVGTEYRKAVVKRAEFWRKIILEIKTIYKGPITYAENWDNYHNVKFWDLLDFIGIDAYFPLSEKARPELSELKSSWGPIVKKLKKFSEKHGKKVIFTEYGYKSVEYTNAGYWNYKDDTVKVSMENQANAYKALFETIWTKDWMVGGFFWKWHFSENDFVNGPLKNTYTPQDKLAMKIIRETYAK